MKKLDIEIIKSIISTIKKVTKKKNVSKLHVPTLSKLEGIYLKKCLDTNMLSTIGPFVEIFENKLKKITKAKHVIATINGTSALHIALKLININKSSEVLIPSLNFVASTNATLYCDGTPHFIDVEEKTLGVDFDKLDNYLTEKQIESIKKKLKLFFEERVFNKDKKAIIQIAKFYESYIIPPEMINAYTWYNIAVAKGIKTAKNKRNETMSELNEKDLLEAQTLSIKLFKKLNN